MHVFEALKYKALRDTLRPNTDYYIRKVARWYSKTFATPLTEAFELPLEHLLQAFYESRFENMEQEDIDEELREMTETEEERKTKKTEEEKEQAAEDELLRLSVEANNNKLVDKANKINDLAKPRVKPLTNALPDEFTKLSNVLKQTSDIIKQEMLTDPEDMPPDIDMNFEDDESFQRLIEMDSSEVPVKGKG